MGFQHLHYENRMNKKEIELHYLPCSIYGTDILGFHRSMKSTKASSSHSDTKVAAGVGVFGPPGSKFVFTCLARMVCSEDTRVYSGLGGTSLRPIRCCLCYRHLICSRGYKQAREGDDLKSLVEGVNGC